MQVSNPGMTKSEVQTIVNESLTTSDSAVTTTERTNWNAAYTAKHTHDNWSLVNAVDATVLTVDDKAVAGGVATLDENGTIPISQLSDTVTSGLKWISTIDVTTETVDDASDSNDGYFYKNTVAGTSSITGTELEWTVGDWLISNGTEWQRIAATESSATTTTLGAIMLAGDLGGTASAPTVTGIQGVTVDDTDIADGYALMYDSDSKTLKYKEVATGFTIGDVKESLQDSDHDGWVVADGRDVSELTSSQQTAAATLGYTDTIPDWQDKFVVGAGNDFAIGDTGGTFTIALANLPKTNIASGKTVTVKPYGSVSASTSTSTSTTIGGRYSVTDGTASTAWGAVCMYGSYSLYSDEGSSISGTGNGYIQISSDIADNALKWDNLYHTHTATSTSSSSTSVSFSGTSKTYSLPTMYINGGVTQTEYYQPYVALKRFLYLGA